jgi:hypothetical protein
VALYFYSSRRNGNILYSIALRLANAFGRASNLYRSG